MRNREEIDKALDNVLSVLDKMIDRYTRDSTFKLLETNLKADKNKLLILMSFEKGLNDTEYIEKAISLISTIRMNMLNCIEEIIVEEKNRNI